MRVTVDKDKPINQFRLLQCYFNMENTVGVDEIKKSSRGGYHLKSRGNAITHEQMLRLRRFLGGDPKRIGFDTNKLHMPKQVLWSNKEANGKTYESEEIDRKNLLALPFNSRVPRGCYVGRD